ncbi:MAG: hypothetical protein ACI8P9_002164 [Parasphingorhabdus sp.]
MSFQGAILLKLWHLNVQQKVFLLRAWWRILFTWLNVNYFSKQKYLARIGRLLVEQPPTELSSQLYRVRDLMRLVSIAANYHLVPNNCLIRSLVGLHYLAEESLAGVLKIGVMQTPTGLLAHAWIELDGVVVNDKDDVRDKFSVFNPPEGEDLLFMDKLTFIN